MGQRKKHADLPNSGYLQGWRPRRSMKRNLCFYCGRRMHSVRNHGGTATEDHIIPSRDRTQKLQNVVLTRPCCRECNDLRNRMGHCVGALMLVIQFAAERGVDKTGAAMFAGTVSNGRQSRAALYAHIWNRNMQSRTFLNTYLAA